LPNKEIIQDDVICLTRREFSETSQVLVFMSRDHGKVSVLAKGVKRPRGKTAGGIDLLDEGTASVILSREGLSLLREFLPGRPRPTIRNDLRKWYASLYLAEVTHISTKELEPASRVYDLLLAGLDRIATSSTRDELGDILVRVLAELLAAIGYRPEFRSCAICRRQLTPHDQLYLSATSGGLVCRDCEPAVVEKIHLEHRPWYYLSGNVHALVSASMAFDALNYLLGIYLERTPVMRSYCRSIFETAGSKGSST